MIPVSKATWKIVNRFPALYKTQALQALEHDRSEAIRMTADSFVMAAMLALVEEFGFGTTKNSTRINRFVTRLQEVIDTNAEYYDEAVVEGLHNKLRMLGIDYNLRD